MKQENKHETEPKTLPIASLTRAEWNTHRASKHDDAAYKGLIDSLRANGMMHRVTVTPSGDNEWTIIDGHRRVEAAGALGWKEVPCEVYPAMAIDEAQELTLTANLQRLENDPLLEAACIEELAGAGKTYEQIAAIIGKDTRYVARRARLCNLTERWRNWFAHVDADADTMETVAAHEKELQDEVYDLMKIDSDGEVDADDIERCFARSLRKIGMDTPFDTAECATCPFNTATHGWLFPPEDEDEGCTGRCEKAACFTKKWNAATDAAIERLRAKKVDVKEARQKWDVPNYWEAKAKKDKRHTQAWIFTEDGLKRLVWATPKSAPVNTAPAKTEAEKKAEREIKAKYKAWKEARERIWNNVRAFASMEDGAGVRKMVEQVADKPAFREWAIEKLWKHDYWDEQAVIDLAKVVGRATIETISPGTGEAEYNALFEPDPRLAEQGDDDALLVEADNFNGEEA